MRSRSAEGKKVPTNLGYQQKKKRKSIFIVITDPEEAFAETGSPKEHPTKLIRSLGLSGLSLKAFPISTASIDREIVLKFETPEFVDMIALVNVSLMTFEVKISLLITLIQELFIFGFWDCIYLLSAFFSLLLKLSANENK